MMKVEELTRLLATGGEPSRMIAELRFSCKCSETVEAGIHGCIQNDADPYIVLETGSTSGAMSNHTLAAAIALKARSGEQTMRIRSMDGMIRHTVTGAEKTKGDVRLKTERMVTGEHAHS